MSTAASFSRVLTLDGGINFRDLGGYANAQGKTVKWRKLLRCGHLANLSAGDIDQLERLNVTQVHDFRRQEEQSQSPSAAVRADFIDDYQISIGDISRFWEFLFEGELTPESSHQLVVNSYGPCIEAISTPFRRFMQEILNNANNASIFHCSAGKDRTGMAAALLLSALDVPRETIIDDYLLTQKHYDSTRLVEIIEGHLRAANVESWDRAWLTPYVSVHRDNIVAFLDSIEGEYGSVKGFLKQGLDFSDSDLEKMQNLFLDD